MSLEEGVGGVQMPTAYSAHWWDQALDQRIESSGCFICFGLIIKISHNLDALGVPSYLHILTGDGGRERESRRQRKQKAGSKGRGGIFSFWGGEREALLTIKKGLVVGMYNALSGNTDSGRII